MDFKLLFNASGIIAYAFDNGFGYPYLGIVHIIYREITSLHQFHWLAGIIFLTCRLGRSKC